MDEIRAAFDKVPFLSSLPADEREGLMRFSRIVRVPSGKFLARKGDEVTDVSFIVDGSLRLCEAGTDGKEASVALLGPGAHLGIASLLCGERRTTDVVATWHCILLTFDARMFCEQLSTRPALSFRMLESLAHRLNETSRHLIENALYGLNRRLALRLVDLAEPVDFGGEMRMLVRERPSHRALGTLLGVTRESVTRALRALEEDGAIEVRDNQVIVNSTFDRGD